RAPGDVTRELTAAGALHSFAPEQATLERIYLNASRLAAPAHERANPPPATTIPTTIPAPTLGRTGASRWRSFVFETGTLLRRRSTIPLLLLPCGVAWLSVHGYQRRVEDGLALVEAGERFSADAGSGYLAVAQALQAATPVLALALLWFASQTFAADVAGDTLRNTYIRSLRRQDVLFGKLAVLLATAGIGWLLLCATGVVVSLATVGFGDLEEVSRYGDRDLLAAADEVRPVMLVALAQLALPLAAVVAVATAASAVARRPALALALAALFVLGPELLRTWLPEHGGWLLTSQLPVAWRDDSVLAYLGATARGAADALWLHADVAAWAPLAWLGAATAALVLLVQRMRIS
ncbi:MAG: hypothetical protein KAI24_21735, partial [Planctomycetes bacterium]|nr:hypothetical protein [Planctomycetota bacterium]